MGIRQAVEWSWVCSPQEADERLRAGCTQLGMDVTGGPGQLRAAAKRSLLKNRWAAELSLDLAPAADGGTTVTATVDMAGNKHFELLDELAGAAGDEVFADLGLAAAIQRLGKTSRVFGRKEVRHLHNLLQAAEHVVELGQGIFDGKQGLVVLTDRRLFFFEKSLGSERLEEFPLGVISSINVGKKMGGETLTVYASGNGAEIKQMMHGQADALARAFRGLRAAAAEAPTAPTPAPASADDPVAQLERLAGLKERGILSAEEFEAKKAELLGRL